MRGRFKGHEYITVLRPQGERDRGGDLPPKAEHRAGPCSVAWSTAWASVKEVVTFPMDGTDRDVTIYFDHVPDVRQDDYVKVDGITTEYRVVAIEPWRKRSNGQLMGCVIRVSGLETGR